MGAALLSLKKAHIQSQATIKKQWARSFDTNTHGLELVLISTTVLLTTISLLFIYASSSTKGIHISGDPYLFLKKQLIITFFCWFFLLVAPVIHESFWEKIPLWFYLVMLLVMMGILIPGLYVEVGGAKRWLKIGGLRWQPVEFAKLAMILMIAKNLARPGHRTKNFVLGILPNFGFFLAYGLLLMLQPDFGTTVTMGAVCVMILALAGTPKKIIFGLLATGTLAVSSLILTAPYRWERITAFLHPWEHVHHGGFQIIQSYLGFQNGSLLGQGLGESKQKLFFLPEAHTDFILAVIAEELGFIGIAFILFCYFTLIYCAFRITQKQTDSFWYYSCFGITMTISIQTIFNMGVVMGMLPTKGIPLPLISTGASSLLSYSAMIGFLLVANKRYPQKNSFV
ncbi:MAG: putative lipid II flippase FtsW [Proteobacteria bacterium]|nr:putative lipid II flippase FtsW [Pseudomonadota bacterium]